MDTSQMTGLNARAVLDAYGEIQQDLRRIESWREAMLGQYRTLIGRLDAMEATHEADRAAWDTERKRLQRTIHQMGDAFLRANAGKEALWAGIGRIVVDRSVAGLIVDGKALLDVVEAARELQTGG